MDRQNAVAVDKKSVADGAHADIGIFVRGRVLYEFCGIGPGDGFVRAHHVFERQDMSGRGHLAGIGLADDIDMFEDGRKLLFQLLALLLRQGEPGEQRHMVHGFAVNAHMFLSPTVSKCCTRTARLSYSVPYLEIAKAIACLGPGRVYPLDLRLRWTAFEPEQIAFQCGPFALRDHLNRAVTAIAHVATQAERQRLAPREEAIPDALHVAMCQGAQLRRLAGLLR